MGISSEQIHEFLPVYDKNSRILILGTFPSVKSREGGFYYGHQRNRFWRVVSAVTEKPLPVTIEDKKRLLLENGIALWDVIQKCDIIGSSDSSIKNVYPNDISVILREASIVKVFANGNTAKKLYDRYTLGATGMEITVLPSTSPANAAFGEERLIEKWSVIKAFL